MGKETPNQKLLKSYQQEWRHVLITLAFKRYKHENLKFKASLGYEVRLKPV